MPERHTVNAFVSLVEGGRFIDALQRYYHPAAVVWENLRQSRTGLDALMENEHQMLARFATVTAHAARVVIDGDHVVINWRFGFYADSVRILLDEVAVQQWADGKIVHERFYYDPAQMHSGAPEPAVDGDVREAMPGSG